MEVKYLFNTLRAETLASLRLSAGWFTPPVFQIEKALANTYFTVSAMDGDDTVGMGRLIGDGAMIWYIQDLIVLPGYQGRGIGRAILEHLMAYAEENSLSGTTVTIGLMAAKGKEPFYEKFGFRTRPNVSEGAGMIVNRNIAD